jgi:hypothetical protein
LQAGGHRFDPGQLHHLFSRCCWLGSFVRDADSGFRLRAQTPAKRLKFDPGQLHQLIRCFLMAAVLLGGCDQEACRRRETLVAGFKSLRARPSSGFFLTKATMFDNEIDWVTCSKELADPPRGASAGVRLLNMSNTRPSTSNESRVIPKRFGVSRRLRQVFK